LRIPPRLCTSSRCFGNRGHDHLGPHVSRSIVTNRCLGKHQARCYGIHITHLDASALIKYRHVPAGEITPPLSKQSSTNIIKATRGKRNWPHLRVHCLSRCGLGGHCRYHADRVPPCIRLNSSPTAPDSAPDREGLRCHRMSLLLQAHSRCQRALASPCAMWHRARHPSGKSSGIATRPVVPDPPTGVRGLWCHHVPRGTRPTTRQGRALVSPRVPRL
jgi:hypothetical protein